MKTITNQSLQGLEIYIRTPQGEKPYWVKPKESIVVSESSISKHVKRLLNRKMISVSNYR